MKRIFVLTMATVFAWLGSHANAAIVVLDSFIAGTTDLTITAAAPPTQSASETQTGLAGVAGGSRFVKIEKLSGTSGSTRNVTGSVDAANGEFAYVSGNSVVGALQLAYDGNGAGLNVQLGSIDSFLVNFVDGDYGPTRTIPVTITITAANDATGSLTQTLSSEGAATLEFFVANFSNLSGLNLGTNTVKKVEASFAPTATSTDFTLATFEIIPEPSAYALALAGLACGGFSAWRRSICQRRKQS